MPIILLKTGRETKVSKKDLAFLSQWAWSDNGGYAFRLGGRKRGESRVWMHRVILERMGFNLEELQGDHINRDSFDNRRENLRPATPKLNAQNRIVSNPAVKTKEWVEKIVATRRKRNNYGSAVKKAWETRRKG